MAQHLMIFNIQRFSTHDGEGVRTMVFLKGCPLRCTWCSNPESQAPGPEVLYDPALCQRFGDCLGVGGDAITAHGEAGIRIDRNLLMQPEQLRNLCASKALTISGQKMSLETLMSEIEKDRPFYRDSGGVTLSGGEPLAQKTRVVRLLGELLKKDIRVDMETSLHVPWEWIQACIPLTATFLADLKHTDSAKFMEFTGGDAKLVMDNLVKLSATGVPIVVRIPVITGFNHSEREMVAMIDFILSLKRIREVHFLPFHTLGGAKYRMLGRENPFTLHRALQANELQPYVEYAESRGLKTKTGG